MPKLAAKDFAGRTWLTRARPEIDRVGSAWLIRKFLDPKARFVFAADRRRHPDALPFDILDVEFTHHGEDCTFETLEKRFGINDKAVQKIAEMMPISKTASFAAQKALAFSIRSKAGLPSDSVTTRSSPRAASLSTRSTPF
jgi:hypothetical protein